MDKNNLSQPAVPLMDGCSIRMWEYIWLSKPITPPNSNLHAQLRVYQLIDQPNRAWNIQKVRSILPANIAKQVVQIPITHLKDIFFWPHTRDGDYSVKSSYQAAKSIKCKVSDMPSTCNNLNAAFWKSLFRVSKYLRKSSFFFGVCATTPYWLRRIQQKGILLLLHCALSINRLVNLLSMPSCFAHG